MSEHGVPIGPDPWQPTPIFLSNLIGGRAVAMCTAAMAPIRLRGSVGQDRAVEQHREEQPEQEQQRDVEHAARCRVRTLA